MRSGWIRRSSPRMTCAATAKRSNASLMIIDSEVHVWPRHRPDRPLGEAGLDRTPFGYQELLAAMDVAGIDRAILVPPSFDRDRNDYVIEAVQQHPDRFAIMGRVSLQGGGGRNARGMETPARHAGRAPDLPSRRRPALDRRRHRRLVLGRGGTTPHSRD